MPATVIWKQCGTYDERVGWWVHLSYQAYLSWSVRVNGKNRKKRDYLGSLTERARDRPNADDHKHRLRFWHGVAARMPDTIHAAYTKIDIFKQLTAKMSPLSDAEMQVVGEYFPLDYLPMYNALAPAIKWRGRKTGTDDVLVDFDMDI